MIRTIIKAVKSCVCAVLLLTSCDAILPNELPSGTPLWARSVADTNTISTYWSSSKGNNCIYAAGQMFNGSIQFGNNIEAIGINSSGNLILTKYDMNGTPVWTKYPISTDTNSSLISLAGCSEGVYASGWLGPGTFNLGDSFIIPAYSTVRGILLYVSNDGVIQWVNVAFGTNHVTYKGIIADNSSIYVIGEFYGTGTFDFGNSIQISGTNSVNPVIVKFNRNGLAQWAKTITGISTYYEGIAIDGSSIYIAGNIYGTGAVNFGNSITADGKYSGYNPLIVKYNESGDAQWAKTTEYSFNTDIYFNSIDARNGIICAAGYIDGNVQVRFGWSVSVNCQNPDRNCVLVRYNSDGTPQWARTATAGVGLSSFYGVKISGDSIYASGNISGFSTYGFGNGVFIDALAGASPLVINYNISGNAEWARSMTGVEDGFGLEITGISIDDFAVYLTGQLNSGIYYFSELNKVSLPAGPSVFLIKYKN